ncbi:Myosin-14 [Brucella inopinata BO1]|nr:Myosin-14 [Brucella inopinata BO1]
MTLARQQDDLKRIPLLEQNIARLEKRLGEEEKGAAEARQARDRALEKAEILQAELERVQGHYVALESLADTLRIEISAHEAEISRLMSEITEMRHDRKDATARYNELSTQLTAAQTKLKSETRRNGELQQKLEKLISELSDAQEKLERQNRHGDGALMSTDQIEIARENAALREEMATLAARMVAVTAEREGPDSPIHKLLKGTAVTEKGKGKKNKAPKSLATRIRDMQ